MRANLLMRVVEWLRSGYPKGVPREDYIALFGILHRDLTAAEIEHVVRILRSDPAYPATTASIPDDQIGAVIEQLVHERASNRDIERVQARLAEAIPLTATDEHPDQPDGPAGRGNTEPTAPAPPATDTS